jgi:hypothetical protein
MWKWLIATLLILSSCVQIPFDYGKPEMTHYELAKSLSGKNLSQLSQLSQL